MIGHEQQINQLLAAKSHASLATIICEQTHSPYVSRVEYSQAQDGSLILLLPDSAKHINNIKKISKASLLIIDDQQDHVMDTSSVSLQVDLFPVNSNSEHVKRHYSYYPQAGRLVKELEFNFYRATVSHIYWFKCKGEAFDYRSDVIKPSPFSYDEEQAMINHMNSDHSEAIQHYCDKVSIVYGLNDLPTLVGISAYGFHVRTNKQLYWFAFDSVCENVNCVRKALVKMAQS